MIDDVTYLRARVVELESEVRTLRVALAGNPHVGAPLKLTPLCRRLLDAIAAASPQGATKQALIAQLGSRGQNDSNLYRHMLFLRRDLRDRGVEISTIYGGGYRLDEGNKARLDALIAQHEGTAA